MSTFAVRSLSHSPVSGFAGTIQAVVAKVAGIAIAIRNRREISQLAGADAAMLRDLGITPMDIDGALAEPLWRDPSAHLVQAQSDWRRAATAAKHDNYVGLHG